APGYVSRITGRVSDSDRIGTRPPRSQELPGLRAKYPADFPSAHQQIAEPGHTGTPAFAFSERNLVDPAHIQPVSGNVPRRPNIAAAVERVFRNELIVAEIPVVVLVVDVASPSPGALEIEPVDHLALHFGRQPVVLVARPVSDVVDFRVFRVRPSFFDKGPIVG